MKPLIHSRITKLFLSLWRKRGAAIVTLFFGLTAFGQNPKLDELVAQFEEYRSNNYQEKLYIQIDRNTHLTGETLWFKIYLLDASLHKPSDLSSVAYVELINRNNIPELQTKVGIKKGLGDGSFYLPATLNTGNYTLRAYTNWMKNTGVDLFFERSVTIINPFRIPDPVGGKPEEAEYDAQFLPEGGHLVAGLTSTVAFRVTDHYGKGVRFKGVLVDQKNDTITHFEPHKFGIGRFDFTPRAQDQYYAMIKGPDNKNRRYELPLVNENGFVLHLEDSASDQLLISVNSTMNASTVYLFVHARQRTVLTRSVNLLQDGMEILLDKTSLPAGISHFTLFNENLQPVCERLYFKSPGEPMTLEVGSNQPLYDTRSKVAVTIDSSTPHQTNTRVNAAISVYRIDSLEGYCSGNIVNHIYLNSDLTGHIEEPEYYFTPSGQKDTMAIDNLMLTHGWSRFSWEDVFDKNPKEPEFLPEPRSHVITGKVTRTSPGPARRITVFLSSPSRVVRLYPFISYEDGNIRFEMNDFYGSRKIILLSDFKRDSLLHFEINNPFTDQYSNRPLPVLELDQSLENTIVSRSIDMQVQDIYRGTGTDNLSEDQAMDSSAFYGEPDARYYLDDYIRFPVMEEVIREYVYGVWVRKNKDRFRFLIVDEEQNELFENNILTLFDGMPVFDINKIMEFDPLKVERIDVINKKYIVGPSVFNGIVSFSTYNGDLAGFEIDPDAMVLDYDGLQLKREFYTPRYDTPQQRNSRIPDHRDHLYWDPDIVIDNKGKIELEFFTSDRPGNYRIVVEGISDEGMPGYVTDFIKVEESK